jgi:hypothetical protein
MNDMFLLQATKFCSCMDIRTLLLSVVKIHSC